MATGPEAVAFQLLNDLRVVVSRRDLSVRWSGVVRDARPIAWCDKVHLAVRTGRGIGVWSLSKGKILWKAAGRGAVLRDRVLVLEKGGTLEIRPASTGAVAQTLPLGLEAPQSICTVGETLVVDLGGSLLGVQLSGAEDRWTTVLPRDLPDTGTRQAVYAQVMAGTLSSAVVKYDTGLARIDLRTGIVQWNTRVPTNHLPVVSSGRIGFLFNGHLLILDEATGKSLATVERAADTLWEAQPCAHDDWMVVVDKRGHIATVALLDGRILGVQQEKACGFSSCDSVDGRLWAAGTDGALWVYEPIQQRAGHADGRSEKATVATTPTGKGALRPAGGSKSPRAGRPASKAKAKRR